MSHSLVVQVRLHDGRFHGHPEWPPAPARLFQALVAAAGPCISTGHADALRWLETLGPPVVGASRHTLGQAVTYYVPNNDLDAYGADPAKIPDLRVGKVVRPMLFDGGVAFLYAWRVASDGGVEQHIDALVAIADRVYQFGRGLDMAWARAALLDEAALGQHLADYTGTLFRPTPGATSAVTLACPTLGSLESLLDRHAASGRRFETARAGKKSIQVFVQPPKALFSQVPYDAPAQRALFDLRPEGALGTYASAPLALASAIAVAVRDRLSERLASALPQQSRAVESTIIGRRENSATTSTPRVRIVPLASIGHEHVDMAIRRVLVEVPPGCALRPGDVLWAAAGLDLPLPGEPTTVLTPAEDLGMLAHYGIGDSNASRTWRTVTPAALPVEASRRRVEPSRIASVGKGGPEREDEQRRAAFAVTQALRHAGIDSPVAAVRVQREPFHAHGDRAESFANGTRFPKERLWHVEVTFRETVGGPLVIGDGRYLGLGIMAPARRSDGLFVFRVDRGLTDRADPAEISRALRRALMARAQASIGRDALPAYISGHTRDGAPARSDLPHLSYAFDPVSRVLFVVAPHVRDHREAHRNEGDHLRVVERALAGLTELRAGRSGRLSLTRLSADGTSLSGRARTWASRTPYVVNRHGKSLDAHEALAADVRASCHAAALPVPQVRVLEARGIRGLGLVGRVEIRFATATEGPLLLGRTRHLGGGLFAPADEG